MEQRLIDKIVQAKEFEAGDIVLLNFWGSEEEIEDFMKLFHTPHNETFRLKIIRPEFGADY